MIRIVRRVSLGAVALVAAALIAAGPVLADHCTNASKPPAAGVQVVIDTNTGAIVWISNGLQHRVDQGLVDPNTGAGFSGLIGFDFDGDAVADVTTYIVGPNMALPEQAQLNGAECHGIVSIETFFTECVSGPI
jgi:hypothetical protein